MVRGCVLIIELVPGCVPEEVNGMHGHDNDWTADKAGNVFLLVAEPRRGKPHRSKSVKNVLGSFRGGLMRSIEISGSM